MLRFSHAALAAILFLSLAARPPAAAAQTAGPNWQPLEQPAGRLAHLAGTADGSALYVVAVSALQRSADQAPLSAMAAPVQANALYGSADQGGVWQPLTNDLPPGEITALYADPQGETVYVAVQARGGTASAAGLWRSADRGRQWRPAPLPRTDLTIERISRGADGTLYLAATTPDVPASNLIYRQDAGEAWLSYRVSLPAGESVGRLADLVPHPTEARRLFLTTHANQLLVSSDGGETWAHGGSAAAADPTQRADPPVLALAADRPAQALLVRSTSRGISVARSADGGLTWRGVSTTGLPASSQPRALVALADGVYLLSTTAGVYRSTDAGSAWQRLEGVLSSGAVSQFHAWAGKQVAAGTGWGLFISRDAGALWSAAGRGLPANAKIAGLVTHRGRPGQLFAITDRRGLADPSTLPPLLRSLDGGQQWQPAVEGLPTADITAWGSDPYNPDSLFVAGADFVAASTDAGASWHVNHVTPSVRTALGVVPGGTQVSYLSGAPALRTTDGGLSWEPLTPIATASGDLAITAVTAHPLDAQQVWAGTPEGVYASSDGGRSWRADGLAQSPISWLTLIGTYDEVQTGAAQPDVLLAGAPTGVYRRETGGAWAVSEDGLPAEGRILGAAVDQRLTGAAWVIRDGGGVYLSADRGRTWLSASQGLGDNLAQAVAVDYSSPEGVFLGMANGSIWARGKVEPITPTPPATTDATTTPDARRGSVDARIEIVWPHAWAPVSEAKQANLGLRLFMPHSLQPPSCGWQPRVQVWQALDTTPARLIGAARQRTIAEQPAPYWELNDIDVSAANDPSHRLYFLVKVDGVDTATSVWAHGSDPRTYFPQQDVPSGLATPALDAIDARIQIVWPHDASGAAQAPQEATQVNVAVALFKHGTRLAVPPSWQPAGLTLYGAWNHEVAQPLSTEATVSLRQAGAITYPVWEFNNIDVTRAAQVGDRLYLWLIVTGVQTYPTIWAHGSDSRTFFPAQDEPIAGCLP